MPGRAHLRNPDPLARSHPPPPPLLLSCFFVSASGRRFFCAQRFLVVVLALVSCFSSRSRAAWGWTSARSGWAWIWGWTSGCSPRGAPAGWRRPRPRGRRRQGSSPVSGASRRSARRSRFSGASSRSARASSPTVRTRGLSRSPPLCVQFTRRGLLVCFFSPPRFADAVVRAPWPAVIDELKQEAAKRGGDAEAKADDGDKRKWMSTAQLWVDGDAKSDESDKEQRSEITSPEPKLLGGAPMPIRAVAAVPPLPPPFFRREDSSAGTGLSLVSPASKAPISPVAASDNASGRFCATMPPSGPGVNLHSEAQQQASRKARRCWSPELHQQFVAALHQLGGPQVATPKQIREVMQVDGLTNDEVKSHLQKYRLHNRRSPGAAPVSQPIMLVGGLWAPQEQSSSGSPQGPLQFSGSGVAISTATVGGGDSSSSDEDKSEGYSRKCV
ncbi:transcription factor HHO5-like isoform X1 [Miscanthus floridulus]|uniref:transcription factor HHO5-like isoform X1 n=1 Tax=Miscanthus floridulus TaxID=154761 RepID=UPI00345A44D3